MDKKNKQTSSSGLSFNVLITKKHLKKYYVNMDLPIPKFRGSHIALTSVLETLYGYCLGQISLAVKESKDGLKHVTVPIVRTVFVLDEHLKPLYDMYNDKFDNNNDYITSLPLLSKELKQYSNAHVGVEYNLTNKGLNYICYYLNTVFNDIVEISNHVIDCSKKKTLDVQVIDCAVAIAFRKSLYLCSLFKQNINKSTFFLNYSGNAEADADAQVSE